ncbi:MAG: ATP-binding protein [Elusimicrobia bacterium]|nr:ATP-binding protein [Elusimicrobiota bacterium]
MLPAPDDAGDASSAPGIVGELVDQFADPLAFYRELIQNAIDAGSNRIDILIDYLPEGIPPLLGGVARVIVEDDGEGMDERIIDGYYLVLFRSAKESDFTKIGRFGIGVMSMFSLRPELVRVHTAKSGESWRLDFLCHEKYHKYRMPEMRDGTRVELFKRMPAGEVDGFVERSLAAVRSWCRHSDTRIYFQGGETGAGPMLINESFSLPVGESLRYKEEGTEVVLGFSAEKEPFFGFYNKGLAIKEGRHPFFPGVTFKVNSRYLEHTLTRDTVLEDDNHRKTMDIVRRLVEDELPLRLKDELRRISSDIAAEVSSGASADPEDARQWEARLPYARWLLSGLLARWKRSDWPMFPAVTGEVLSLDEVRAAVAASDGVVFVDDSAGEAARKLARQGRPVLAAGPWIEGLIEPLTGARKILQASRAFVNPEVLKEVGDDPSLAEFLRTVSVVSASWGGGFRTIRAARLEGAGACVARRLFVVADEPDGLCRLEDEESAPAVSLGPRSGHALLNPGHPFLRSVVALHGRWPGPAAFLCLKMMRLLGGAPPVFPGRRPSNLPEDDEGRLLAAALPATLPGTPLPALAEPRLLSILGPAGASSGIEDLAEPECLAALRRIFHRMRGAKGVPASVRLGAESSGDWMMMVSDGGAELFADHPWSKAVLGSPGDAVGKALYLASLIFSAANRLSSETTDADEIGSQATLAGLAAGLCSP